MEEQEVRREREGRRRKADTGEVMERKVGEE